MSTDIKRINRNYVTQDRRLTVKMLKDALLNMWEEYDNYSIHMRIEDVSEDWMGWGYNMYDYADYNGVAIDEQSKILEIVNEELK